MKKLSIEKVKAFQKEILEWYEKNKRDLPWRKIRDPYAILVSEVMSQQTQISRIIPKYEAWLKKFPTVSHLAQAKPAEVLQYWSGLGYNRRALYLQKCAITVFEKFGGKFPHDISTLKTLPGIGEYTATAVACFAFDQQVVVIDTNIRKVITIRFFAGELPEEKTIRSVADQLLPQNRAYEWNQALMDYASAMLKKEKIPIPKQSRFKDSDRYFRGQIIKRLLGEKQMTVEQLLEIFAHHKTPIERIRLEKIINGLVKDTLVRRKGNTISLQ